MLPTQKEFIANGFKLTVSPRRRSNETIRGYAKKTRVYGAQDALTPELVAEVEKWCSPNVPSVTARFVEEQPEEAERIMQGYRSARRKASREGKKRLQALLTELKFDVGVDYFSTEAGCGCGCSPGFILDDRVEVDGVPVDMWVDVVEEEA